ncbi:MAG TPA: putative toxin-antitoxin system toxin component, PIN family, partial [Phycisphaerae bacterium]|nr:putative toxin-antitoxin system toxin component, PIN family [Phycisphaerae bacterium]
MLDTSVLISALIKGWWREIADAAESGRLRLITSPQAIEEFMDVIARPSKSKLFDSSEAASVADLLRRTELYSPDSYPQVCRDPNDDFWLALANLSRADVLVSRDEDLLQLRR